MYQPRGVGLMHTRHKPSNAHYTHAMMDGAQVLNQHIKAAIIL